ncbi:TSUP family transporter [Marinomonas sp. 15G1-11]|uniref:Probable membrane transporter protein n=1 Tax=Marinomonas phaeophyticola TaxID=3004091 RepID=A0ABT4JVB6_9GAMM|nr:TSUP family transporter [Marinomonas sp. 15G1-11]MCZ2722156.1 TSUP family transporter [Marinomonas sp. 15G1-11]
MDIALLGFSLELYLLLTAVAVLAGAIDAIAGGGGLITVPVLLAAGLSPAEALATNKLQGCAGTLSASAHFIKKGQVALSGMWLAILMTAIGSITGTLLVSYLDGEALIKAIPAILIFVALFFFFLPKVQPYIASKVSLNQTAFALLIGTSIGFYDGLIGPGTGAFFSTAYLCFMGASLITATAHTKVLNATSNVSSLFIFAFTGNIIWGLGIAMGVGQWVGAQIGSRLVITKGSALIRPLVIIMCLAISIKLILEHWK